MFLPSFGMWCVGGGGIFLMTLKKLYQKVGQIGSKSWSNMAWHPPPPPPIRWPSPRPCLPMFTTVANITIRTPSPTHGKVWLRAWIYCGYVTSVEMKDEGTMCRDILQSSFGLGGHMAAWSLGNVPHPCPSVICGYYCVIYAEYSQKLII